MTSIDVVAFDLDDTLISLSKEFIPQYIRHLAQFVDHHFPESAPVVEKIVATSTAMMQKPRDQERLEDFFYRVFTAKTGIDRARLEPVLHTFYRGPFSQLRNLARPVYGAMGLLASVKALGMRVVLLTSALFPAEAIQQRLEWAGIEGFPFDWRSSLEVVHATKPQPGFYQEAADTLGVEPQHWLMVGNDVVEDMVPAHQTGMAIYWVGGVDPGLRQAELPPDTPYGPLHGLLPWLASQDTWTPPHPHRRNVAEPDDGAG